MYFYQNNIAQNTRYYNKVLLIQTINYIVLIHYVKKHMMQTTKDVQ